MFSILIIFTIILILSLIPHIYLNNIINKYDFLECLGTHDYKEYLNNIEKKNIRSIQRMTFRYEMKLFNSLKAIDYIKEINKDLGFKKINHRRVIL